MITLGIETSCDETSCAVLEDGNKLLSNVISSSLKQHKPYGGIVPEIASRHSMENIHTVYHHALETAGKKIEDVDLIAVTHGPGLIGSLLVGLSFAKGLAYSRNIKIVGVNHIEAHLDANLIDNQYSGEEYLGLVVSGGHSMLVHANNRKYVLLGGTIDDAIGEAYDKVAKLMGLGYPGGPVIDAMAKQGNPKRFLFTKPKLKEELNFSFSGIKTAVLYLIRDLGDKVEEEKENIAASFQSSVVSWIVSNVRKAYEKTQVDHLLVGGGVSANSLLRSQLTELGKELNMNIFIPPISLTLDNAGMIAKTGYEKFKLGSISDMSLSAKPNLSLFT